MAAVSLWRMQSYSRTDRTRAGWHSSARSRVFFCSREKLERSGHKGVSALIWRKKRRKEEDRRRRGWGGGVMCFFLFLDAESCFAFISCDCVCLLLYLFVPCLCHLISTCVHTCVPVWIYLCVCVCVSVMLFHSGCGFSSAITQRCSQFVVDLPLSASISGWLQLFSLHFCFPLEVRWIIFYV